jgi:hypothetical protein
MKRLLLIPLTAAVVGVGLLAVPERAMADVVVPTEKPRISAARCSMAKGRITNITDTMRTVSERRTTTYTNIRERAIARVAVLKQKGYDTSKLEADLETVNQQIKDYHAKAEELYGTLSSAQDTACGDSDGDFASALASARTQLKAVREASQAIHQTYRSSVIPDIKVAATWIKNN